MSDAIEVHRGSNDPKIMGIVNVTPDSFSDGGKFFNSDNAIEHALKLIDEGADIIDIGGESTRPGANPVTPEEELLRVIPVIKALGSKNACISIDTRNAVVMKAALEAGVSLVNDISALTHDPDGFALIRDSGAEICLMHMAGIPKTMQENVNYNNVLEDIFNYLSNRINVCLDAGISQNKIIIDPGIGFGKSLEHNLLLISNISKFHDLGCRILLGTSRKSFIAALSKNAPVHERLGGSISSIIYAASQGVDIVRVHDVKETIQALNVYKAIKSVAL